MLVEAISSTKCTITRRAQLTTERDGEVLLRQEQVLRNPQCTQTNF